MKLTTAEDWNDKGFDWDHDSPKSFEETQIEFYRQIQADALRFAAESFKVTPNPDRAILDLANQLHPLPEQK